MKLTFIYTNELYHHGIKGQKWGVRRFQNEDGSLTQKGKERYRNDKDAAYELLKSGFKENSRPSYDKKKVEYDKLTNMLKSLMTEEQQKEANRLAKIETKFDKKFDNINGNDKNGKWDENIFMKNHKIVRDQYIKEFSKPLTNLCVDILGKRSMDDTEIKILIKTAGGYDWDEWFEKYDS